MGNERVSSFRGTNYASTIVDSVSLKEILSNPTLGKRYYFALNANGNTKVFYAELRSGSVSGSFIYEFYRDYTAYSNTEMYPGIEDVLIKVYASNVIPDEELKDLDSTDKCAGPDVKYNMVTYIMTFLDAVQVMSRMPY